MPVRLDATRRLTSLAAGVATVSVMATAATLAGCSPPGSDRRQPADRSTAAPSPAGPSLAVSEPVDPDAFLTLMTAVIGAGPADPTPARYEYLELRTWDSRATSPSGSPAGPPPVRVQRWTTGRRETREITVDDSHGCRVTADQTTDDGRPFDGPMPTDPAAVRRAVLHEPAAGGPTTVDVFGQITELFSNRFVPLATRQAILQTLAALPGISVQVKASDRAGRTGFALTWTYAPPMPFTVTKTLIVDPSTGQLLASHSHAQRRVDATTPPDPTDFYQTDTLVLTSGYTPDTHTPTAGCP